MGRLNVNENIAKPGEIFCNRICVQGYRSHRTCRTLWGWEQRRLAESERISRSLTPVDRVRGGCPKGKILQVRTTTIAWSGNCKPWGAAAAGVCRDVRGRGHQAPEAGVGSVQGARCLSCREKGYTLGCKVLSSFQVQHWDRRQDTGDKAKCVMHAHDRLSQSVFCGM